MGCLRATVSFSTMKARVEGAKLSSRERSRHGGQSRPFLAHKQESLFLGNLEAKRDWGYAPEYVEAMWKILQQDEPGDIVLGTGEAHSVREFLEEVFDYVQTRLAEIRKNSGQILSPLRGRNTLIADTRTARNKLGWQPQDQFQRTGCD